MTTEEALKELDRLEKYMEYFTARQIAIRLQNADALSCVNFIRPFGDWVDDRGYSVGYYFNGKEITVKHMGAGYQHEGAFKRQEYCMNDRIAFNFSEPEINQQLIDNYKSNSIFFRTL